MPHPFIDYICWFGKTMYLREVQRVGALQFSITAFAKTRIFLPVDCGYSSPSIVKYNVIFHELKQYMINCQSKANFKHFIISFNLNSNQTSLLGQLPGDHNDPPPQLSKDWEPDHGYSHICNKPAASSTQDTWYCSEAPAGRHLIQISLHCQLLYHCSEGRHSTLWGGDSACRRSRRSRSAGRPLLLS